MRVQVKIFTVNFAVEIDCDFDFESREWSCSKGDLVSKRVRVAALVQEALVEQAKEPANRT